MMGTMTLTEFLLARICEDEDDARTASRVRETSSGDRWEVWTGRDGLDSIVRSANHTELAEVHMEAARHIARHDPARVLVECAAKRRIMKEAFEVAATIDGEWGCCHDAEDIRRGYREPTPGDEAEPLPGRCVGPEEAARFLRPLALPYADHPDYDEEWRP